MQTRTFDLQPHLAGGLLSLRPLQIQDFEELYRCASDPKIWEQHPQSNRHERPVFQKFFDGAIESKGALVAIDLVGSKMMGCSRYYDLNMEKIGGSLCDEEILDDKPHVIYQIRAQDFLKGQATCL
jgi:hypothetical protein